jgi:hypothetical protein
MASRVGVEIADRFNNLFRGLESAYGTYDVNKQRDDGKLTGDPLTKREPVTLRLWEDHLAGVEKKGIGIVPIRANNTCYFGAIDVDKYDVNLQEIAIKLRKNNLPLIVCRSKSGGAHLYCFAKVEISAALMQGKLREVAAYLGYGGCEIFPKQTMILVEKGDVGQWINMPYYGGVHGMRYAIDVENNALSMEQFLDVAEQLRVDESWFKQLLIVANDSYADGPPCLQVLAKLGYPDGTRNDGLYNVGVYLKKTHPDSWEVELSKHNHELMQPPLTPIEVQGVIKSLKKKEYSYACTKQPIVSHCNATLCRSRKYGVGGGGGRFPSLGGLAKLNVKPPIWFWTVDGVRIELTTSEIQDPRAFQRRCMDALHQMPPVPKADVWQAAVQQAMDSVLVIDAPVDASPEGQFWEMIEKFCIGRSQALSLEEILRGKPFTQDNKTYFRLSDVLAYLNNNKFFEFKSHKIASLLKDAGAEHHVSNFKGRTVNYWSIPAFARQVDTFEVPDSVSEGAPPF